jgi:hypothetical protein
VWFAASILTRNGLKPLAEATILKGRSIAPGALKVLVIPPAIGEEAEREGMARAPNTERPG